MADYKLTAALNAATFPLVTRYQNRSVIIPQYDGKLRDPASNPQTNLDNNPQDIPQVIYCENVIPNADGILSTGLENVASPAGFPGAGVGDDVFIVRDGDVDKWFFAPAQGMNYIRSSFAVPWVSTNPLAGAPISPNIGVSLAEVNGVSYVCYANTTLLKWQDTANFIDVSGSLVGAFAGSIRSICGSGNYLIAIYADNSIKWSSLTDALDFTPSAATGAGSQIPLDMKGPPLFLSPISGGFLIHCQENTVAAVYTQNVAQPWIFREVKNSGGLAFGFAAVSRESSTGFIYQYSTYGLQQLDLRTAEIIHPQVTEFLSLGVLESFDPLTKLLSIVTDNTMVVKIAFLVGRYLVVSYGTVAQQYSHALWYDAVLKRWGRLKFLHADLFAVGGSVYALRPDGSVTLVAAMFDGSGVIIFGRYQLSRSALLCSQETELELLDASNIVTVSIAVNYNGTTVGEVLPMIEYANVDNYRKYQRQIEGVNLSYIIEGSFKLASILYTFTKGARF